jgi:hypothetical protein
MNKILRWDPVDIISGPVAVDQESQDAPSVAFARFVLPKLSKGMERSGLSLDC